MFNNKEAVGYLVHRLRSRLMVIAIYSIVAQLALYAAYDNVAATSSDDDRKLGIQCETGSEDVCLIAACMGHPCVWYQNSSGGVERNFDVTIAKYTTPGLDTPNIQQVDDDCIESTSNIRFIGTSEMDSASGVNNNHDDDEDEDDNNNDSILTKLLDNDYDSKWEEQGFGSFIQADLGSVQPICNVGIAWDKGDERSYNFVISTSDDGTTFTDVLRGTSTGSTEALEEYELTDVDSRFIRVTVFGNNDDDSDKRDRAAINEIRIGTPASGGAQFNNNSSNGQSELFENSLYDNNNNSDSSSNNNTSSSTNSTEISPDNYLSELTDLIFTDSFQDRVQKQRMDTNLPPSVEDLNIRAASVSSLEIELKGSDLNSPNELDYAIVDLPMHGVLKDGTDQGRVLYYPNSDYIGTDKFTYRAIDDQGLESVPGTVVIAIEDS